ncbi:hypothetical protein GGF41_008705, partial [Coemansia sp. RSA 2531]
MDQPIAEVQDGGYAGDSESRPSARPSSSRWHQHVDVFTGSTGSIHLGTDDGGFSSSGSDVSRKGKGVARGLPEMQQVQPTASRRLEPPATTVEAIEEDLSTDDEPIPKMLFIESQDFEGYRPVGFHIQEHREEMRKIKRERKEAAKRGTTVEYQPERIVSPLWFMENNYLEPLPPDLHQKMLAERDICEALKTHRGRQHSTEHPELKRELESTISMRRLQEEFEGMQEGAGHGTIKALTKRQNKRARKSGIAGLFDTDVTGRRKSFLDSVEIPVSEDSDSDESVGQQQMLRADEAFGPIISQDFQASGHELYQKPIIQGPPRKRLVLRAPKNKTFSER